MSVPESLGEAATKGLELVELFGPRSGYVTMNTYKDPALLGNDEVQWIENRRSRPGALVVSPGTTQVYASTGLPSGFVVRGEYSGPEGTFMAVTGSGITVGSGTSAVAGTAVFRWVGTSSAYSEVTFNEHPIYGTTRFTGTSNAIEFAVVREPVINVLPFTDSPSFTGGDKYLVFTNGTEYSRVMQLADAYMANSYCGIAYPITPPSEDRCRFLPTMSGFSLANTTCTVSATSTHATIAKTVLSGVGQYIAISFLTSSTTSTAVSCTFPNTINAATLFGGMLHMVYDSVSADIWNSLRVTLLVSGGGEHILHDPVSTSSHILNGTASGGQVGSSILQSSVSLNQRFDTLSAESTPSLGIYAGIKFTWVGTAPASAKSMRLFAVGLSGGVDYGSDIKATYYCGTPEQVGGTLPSQPGYLGGSRGESAAILLRETNTPFIGAVGGTPLAGVRLAQQSGFKYTFLLSVPNPTGVSASQPVTHIIYYRRGPDMADYEFCGTSFVGRVSSVLPNWTFITGSASSTRTKEQVSNFTYPRTPPPVSAVQLPIGDVLQSVGPRFFVGNAKGFLGDTGVGIVASSSRGYPFRFTTFVATNGGELDPSSGTWADCFGRTVMVIAPASDSPLGAEGINVLTDRDHVTLDSTDATSLSLPRYMGPHGTKAKHSWAVYRGVFMYLDVDNQIRGIGLSNPSPSLGRIDSLLQIPAASQQYAYGVCFEDQYLLAFPDPDTSTTKGRVVIYNFRSDTWGIDTKATEIRGWRIVDVAGQPQLWAAHADGKTLRHEDPAATSDNGATMTSKVRFRQFVDDQDGEVQTSRATVRTDAHASATLTSTRYTPDAVTGTFTITGTGEIWKFDFAAGGGPPGSCSKFADLEIVSTQPPGSKIRQVGLEVAKISGTGPSA